MIDQPVISQNDRTMAGLAHLGVIIPFWGMIAAIVIWVTHKDKSNFIVFQAIQALIYQVLLILVTMLGMGCYMISFFGMVLTISSSTSESSAFPAGFFLPFAAMGGIFIIDLAFIIYGIVAAVMNFTGKNFRYILLGGWVEKYLNKGS